MKRSIALGIVVGVVACWCSSIEAQQPRPVDRTPDAKYELANAAYRLAVQVAKDEVRVTLDDKQSGLRLAEGPYFYQAKRFATDDVVAIYRGLTGVSVDLAGSRLTIRGKIAGLDVEQVFEAPADRPILEERFLVHNRTDVRVRLADFQAAFVRPLTDGAGKVLPELAADRFVAVPFRAKPDDPKGTYNDFSTADLIEKKGYEVRVKCEQRYDRVPADRRQSEGWAWTHGPYTLGISKFDQENMQWSVLAVDREDRRASLRVGGVAMIDGEPSDLGRIQPGQTVRLGVTRYRTVAGGYPEAMYAFRGFLDEKGCRFPKGFNPPVHWEQLYDMEGAWDDRLHRYTKAIVEKEAQKGVAYHCEALYLDPGWDTGFATFLWGDQWLGPRKVFVAEMQSKYGLKVSLHTPLASWMSVGGPMGPDIAPATYPAAALRKAPPMAAKDAAAWESQSLRARPNPKIGASTVCLGSKAYLDEAARRLLDNCADGVVYLMFDGNWYQGGCNDPAHGHPVPFTKEDHMRANLELARRVHEKYPAVLIEMHDMMMGGANPRNTPVYYKYGLPGSYDLNWGFELMWNPMNDITSGRARSLYYYNLSCNVPIYLHIDLRKDTPGCVVLWWYASTCRHLGIGGTHRDPAVVAAQKTAMRTYHELEAFFKRGDFYGINEEVHLHALPEEKAFVANLFNLSDRTRVIGGSIALCRMGLNFERLEAGAEDAGSLERGVWTIRREMAPWSSQVIHVRGSRP
jgi:hypothetical protein